MPQWSHPMGSDGVPPPRDPEDKDGRTETKHHVTDRGFHCLQGVQVRADVLVVREDNLTPDTSFLHDVSAD